MGDCSTAEIVSVLPVDAAQCATAACQRHENAENRLATDRLTGRFAEGAIPAQPGALIGAKPAFLDGSPSAQAPPQNSPMLRSSTTTMAVGIRNVTSGFQYPATRIVLAPTLVSA
ncbi:hypothetical protein BH24ACI5_BH24ACI5_23740 [soil metagenome]